MKSYLLCLVLLVYVTDSFSNDSTIVFMQADQATILNLSKARNKKVFICFAPDSATAGSCFMNIELQLSNYKEYGALCNKHFINTLVNPESTEGKTLAKQYDVKNYPCFVFTDSIGNLIHKYSNAYTSKILIEEANKAIFYTNSLSHLTDLFNSGNRNPDIMYSYIYARHNAGFFDSALLYQYLNTQSYEDLALDHNTKIVYDFCLFNFNSVLKPNTRYFSFLYDSSERFMRKYGKDNVASKIVWILNEAVDDAAKSKDEIYFKYIVERLKKYDVGKKYELKNEFGSVNGWLTYTDLVSWNTLEFYSRFGDEQKYQSSFSKYIQDIWNKHDLLNNLAWSYYETMDDTTRLNNAVKCIKRAIELKNDPNFVDTYASLLYKLKKYPEAMHQAKLALQIAIERKIDTKPFLNTIDMVKNKINNTE